VSPLQRLLQTEFRSQDSPNISDDDDDDDDDNNKETVHVITAQRRVAV
jgi:hypothetical protein